MCAPMAEEHRVTGAPEVNQKNQVSSAPAARADLELFWLLGCKAFAYSAHLGMATRSLSDNMSGAIKHRRLPY